MEKNEKIIKMTDFFVFDLKRRGKQGKIKKNYTNMKV